MRLPDGWTSAKLPAMSPIWLVIHWEWLDRKLFELGETVITPRSIAVFLVVILLADLAWRLIRVPFRRSWKGTGSESRGAATERLIHYGVWLLAIGLALTVIGVKLTALFAAGALFAVAIGLATQSLVENFLAGVVLLAEGSMRPGDVIYFEEHVVRITHLGVRASVGQTRDGERVVVPNANLVKTSVINRTKGDDGFRVRTKLRVSYEEDLYAVQKILTRVAHTMATAWDTPPDLTYIGLSELGANSAEFDVGVWTRDPWDGLNLRSDLRLAIWKALRDAHIDFALPQLDLHLDPSLETSLKTLGQTSHRLS